MASSAAAASLDAEVRALLAHHDFLEVVTTGEGEQQRVRVRCELTQHEMVPRADAIASYLGSKKFQKARDWYCYDYSKYEPYIVGHRRKPKSLFCNVTGTVLNRIPAEVEKHVNGKKFKRMKEHVTLSTVKSKGENGDEDMDGDEFDANAFEFENSQAVWSEDEDEEGAGAAPRKQQDDDEDDDEEVEEEEEDVDDDMSDLYPDDDGSEDERVHEAVQKALQAKSGEDAPTGDWKEKKKEPKAKLQKQKKKEAGATGNNNKRAIKGKTVKKRRPQTKRQKTDDA